jgi:integral membrane protein (TIGR01906 family)
MVNTQTLTWDSFLPRFSQALVTALVPILLVLTSVRLLATDAYLDFEYRKPGFPVDHFGFAASTRLDHAHDTLLYVSQNWPAETLAALAHEGQSLFNPRELKHMLDVQTVFQAAKNIWLAGFALLLLSAAYLLSRSQTRLLFIHALRSGGLITLIAVVVVGVLAVLAWNTWFLTFHRLFFAAGTWTFQKSDALIRLFPEKFWFDAALTISGLSAAGGFLLAATGWLVNSIRKLSRTN